MLRDKLFQGLLDKALQERLIRETSKKARTLQEVVGECKTTKNSKVQASVMNENFTVNALKNFKNYRKQYINNQKIEFNCKQCGKKREKKKCPEFGTNCRNCEGRNRWAKMRRTQSKQKNMASQRVNAMEENSENFDIIYIGELKSVNELDAKETNCVWYEKILVNKNAAMFKPGHWVSSECHVLSDEGIKPYPKKIRPIKEFATPNCKEDSQRFLDSARIWEREFELVKEAIVKSSCLKYFNGNKAVTLSVDASENGLGAVLLQEGQPVAYRSVSLTETKQRYAQIEKELMSVIYGLEHFNYYTYGRIVTVQTDHKRIQGLNKKPYDTISPRLQRTLLRLNKYNIPLEYVPVKNLVIADALSRAQSTTDNFDEVLSQEATVRINLLTQASPTKWEEIASLTEGDPEMQDVLFHINPLTG
ncbi:retrovirus-related Pol polyprotein from transposon 297 [Trichonephila clavipes]|nr:retrovirus-related Pol polyprotein from transposon 297 [Trichonephila clavipes]